MLLSPKPTGAGLLWRPFLKQTLTWVVHMRRGRFLVWAPAQGISELSRAQALPQLCVLYNSDILGLCLAWINPAAPFFHFKLDDFEKVP